MMKIEYLKPFYTKVTGNKLRLVFAHQYLTVSKDNEIFHFIPIECKEMIVNLDTEQVENLSEVFVFQKDKRFIRLPLYQLLLITNIHSFINPIIHNEKNKNNQNNLKAFDKILIAKVNFEGLSDLPTSEKTYYFRSYDTDLKINDIVWVDSQRKQQLANFLGYINESEINCNPTKFIIRKANAAEVTGREDFTIDIQESRKCEHTMPDKFSHEIIKLLSEIMQFNKENMIDRYLDNKDFDGLNEFLSVQVS